GDIISDTYTPEQAKIADKILSDEKLYNNENVMNNLGTFLAKTQKENLPLIEQAIATEGLDIARFINRLDDLEINNGPANGIDEARVKSFTSILQDPKKTPFFVKHINNGTDMDTAAFLLKTQTTLNKEREAVQGTGKTSVETQNRSQDGQAAYEIFESRGLNNKEAAAIVKAITVNGVVDMSLQSRAIQLLDAGIAKNKIGDILSSAQITGEYNPKIVDDFQALQNLRLNPLLEKNLAVLNNISPADTAVKFNSKVKNQMKAMIEKLPDETKTALTSKGIDIDGIIQKLDTKIVRTSENIPQKVRVVSGFRSKSKITGFEKVVIDKYNPEEKIWRSEEASKKWAEKEFESIKNGEYKSTAYPDANEHRARILNEWFEFMNTEETIKDNPFAKIILAEFITKDLAPENADLPPQFDRTIAKQVVGTAIEKGQKVSFTKLYAQKIREKAMNNTFDEEVEVDGIKGRWYTVPQTDSSSPNYKANVDKVKAFSDGTNWCIRTYNAEPYVKQGAMHFFVDENGLTQICVRETSPGSVYEIQKRQQNATVPIPYINVIQDYMSRNGLTAQSDCRQKINTAAQAKPQFDSMKAEFTQLAREKNYKAILEKAGITVTVKPDGTYSLSHYTPEINNFTFSDLGIKENDLLSNVSEITGDATFKNSNATALPKLQRVGGKFTFDESNIYDIRNMTEINGY
ncbi:MAG: hypothetical protein LUB59_04005, partial [Candidatus Gastranaerophilales bacterium]|nr:hypothetical protein [Candidatus Gastranaerophilales bacterium]